MEGLGVIGQEFCAPRACAMRADERGVWVRATAWRQLDRGDSTLQESARPPAQSAPGGAPEVGGRESEMRASRSHPVVTVCRESEAFWRVNPTVTGRLTRA